jgi:polysaccharide biosynthesis protein PslJ
MVGMGFGATLGFLAFGYFPGTDLPLYFRFAVGVMLIAFVHRGEATSFRPLVKVLKVFVIVSGVSLIFTGHTLTDAAEFIDWTFTTVVVISFAEASSKDWRISAGFMFTS